MKDAIKKVLSEKFDQENFTFFGVMTWAPCESIDPWKVALRELIEEGYIEIVGQKLLGPVYRVKGN